MPAEFDSGMFTKIPAWHKLGNVTPDYPQTWDEASTLAGLDWEPEKVPLRMDLPIEHDGLPATISVPLQDWNAIVRSDTRSLLSCQPASYATIGNAELGTIIDFVMTSPADEELGLEIPQPKIDALVSLKGGRIVCATIALDRPWRPNGDESYSVPFLVIYTRHDGLGGFRFGLTWVRVVCANTWGMAENDMEGRGTAWTIRHTLNWGQRIKEARDGLHWAMGSFELLKSTAQTMADRDISSGEFETFIDRWLPISTAMTERQLDTAQLNRTRFRALYEAETNSCIKDSFWRLLQTANEFADHVAISRSLDSKVNKQLMGGNPTKSAALRVLESMA